MIHKNCDGAYPEPGEFNDDDQALLDKAYKTMMDEARGKVDEFKIHRALEAIWRVVSDANTYIDEQAPWDAQKKKIRRA